DMGEVEQVVDHELIVARDVEIPGHAGPLGIVVLVIVGNKIGLRGFFSHPDPNEAVTLERRKMPGVKTVRNRCVARNMGADAIAIETDSVIAALDIVAADFAARQRREAVGATVAQNADPAVLPAKDHHALIADRAGNVLAGGELEAVRRNVPL